MTATMLTEYNARRGFKLFGKEGEKPAEVELNQLNDRNVMEEIKTNNMSR